MTRKKRKCVHLLSTLEGIIFANIHFEEEEKKGTKPPQPDTDDECWFPAISKLLQYMPFFNIFFSSVCEYKKKSSKQLSNKQFNR